MVVSEDLLVDLILGELEFEKDVIAINFFPDIGCLDGIDLVDNFLDGEVFVDGLDKLIELRRGLIKFLSEGDIGQDGGDFLE